MSVRLCMTLQVPWPRLKLGMMRCHDRLLWQCHRNAMSMIIISVMVRHDPWHCHDRPVIPMSLPGYCQGIATACLPRHDNAIVVRGNVMTT